MHAVCPMKDSTRRPLCAFASFPSLPPPVFSTLFLLMSFLPSPIFRRDAIPKGTFQVPPFPWPWLYTFRFYTCHPSQQQTPLPTCAASPAQFPRTKFTTCPLEAHCPSESPSFEYPKTQTSHHLTSSTSQPQIFRELPDLDNCTLKRSAASLLSVLFPSPPPSLWAWSLLAESLQ